MKIIITPEYWEGMTIKDHGIYKYVGKNHPYYLVNVLSNSGGYVKTWCINAWGQVIRRTYHYADFIETFKENVP